MMRRCIGWITGISCLLLLLAGCGEPGSDAAESSTEPATFVPDAVYIGSSVDEANQHLTFPLVVPDQVPSPLTLDEIIVHDNGSSSSSLSSSVTMKYAVSGVTNHWATVSQTTDFGRTPEAEKIQETLLRSAPTPSAALPEPSQERHTIAGESVLVTTIYFHDGTPRIIYSWKLGELYVDVSSGIVGELTKADLEQFVVAIIESGADQASN